MAFLEEPSLEYLPPLPQNPAPTSTTTERTAGNVYFPSVNLSPGRTPSGNLSLFDTIALQPNVVEQTSESTAGVLSLFEDNVIPPAGVVERFVVHNGKSQQVQQKYYTIPAKQGNNRQPLVDRQDGSLFDLESGYVDNPAGPAPVFVRPTSTTRPASPSLFDATNQDDVFVVPLSPTSGANYEPSPPAAPNFIESIPANPPAAPLSFAQTDGDNNQLSLTWAQLHASLTPSTDAGSIISSITNSGSHFGGSRPTNVVGPPAPPIGPSPPAPPPIGPPAPPSLIRPPAPPLGPQPPAPPFNLPGSSLFSSLRPSGYSNNNQFIQQPSQQQLDPQQQQQTPGGPTIIIYSGSNNGQSSDAQFTNGRPTYSSPSTSAFNPSSPSYGSFFTPTAPNAPFNPPSSPSYTNFPSANPAAFNPPSSPSYTNFPSANPTVFNPPSSPSYTNFPSANPTVFNPPSSPSYTNFPSANPAVFNPPSSPSFNNYAPANQPVLSPPSNFNNDYAQSNQQFSNPAQPLSTAPQPPSPPPNTYYGTPNSPPASPAFNSYGEPIGVSSPPFAPPSSPQNNYGSQQQQQPQQQQQQQQQFQLPSYVLSPAIPPASPSSSYTPSQPLSPPASNPSYQLPVLSPPPVTYVQQQQQPIVVQQQQQPIVVQQQQQPIVVQQPPRQQILVQQAQQPIVVQAQQQPIVVQQQRPVLVQQQQPVLLQQQPVIIQQQRPQVLVQQTRPVVVQQSQPLVVQQQRPVLVQQQQQQFVDTAYRQASYQPSYEPSYQPSYEPSYQPSYEPSYQTVYQEVAQPVLQPVLQPVIQPVVVQQPVRQVFDPVFRPAAPQVFRVPFKAQKGNKAKAKGKEGKGKEKFKSKGKGPSNSYGAPPASYGAPPSYDYTPASPPAQPQQDPPAFDGAVEVLQPQLDIQYQYRYSGPPIMSRGEKASKKLKKLFYKGAILLGGLGAITAAPIVPGVVGGARKKRQSGGELAAINSPGLSTELIKDSYLPSRNNNSTVAIGNDTTSLFDALPFQGAPIPKRLRKELARYLPPAETINDAECLQKSFCENLIELEDSPFQDSFLFFYSAWVYYTHFLGICRFRHAQKLASGYRRFTSFDKKRR